jgi:predicted nuclease with TOPRIM domain
MYENNINVLNDKNHSLNSEKIKLNEKVINLENKEKELNSKLNGAEQHVKLYTSEVEDLRASNKNLETTRFNQEKLIAEYEIKLNSSETAVSGQKELISQSKALCNANKRENEKLQEQNN